MLGSAIHGRKSLARDYCKKADHEKISADSKTTLAIIVEPFGAIGSIA